MNASVLQREIQRLSAESTLVDNQIDLHQENVVQLLKQTIIEKHYYVQRIFMTEHYYEGKCGDPHDILKEKVFQNENKKVFDNFAALDLPQEFSKGPMKAFLNTLLESLESFLPAFYFLTPSKLPSSNSFSTPADVLVRCVFPTLFGYCWATEPATAYAENLVKWFSEIYQTKPDFISKFRNEWMFNAMRGFFTSLDFQAFIIKAMRPIFFEYIQEPENEQKKEENLVKWANRLLNNFVDNFHYLPSVLNVLFSLLKEEIRKIHISKNSQEKMESSAEDASGADNNSESNQDFEKLIDKDFDEMIKILFYDGIIENFMKYPLLYISDIPILPADFQNFYDIFSIFKIKLYPNENEKISLKLSQEILDSDSFKLFDPMIIKNKILENSCKGKLPSLQDFCNIVQCAHQPLLMSTHHLSLLFRFVASLQHLANLPQAIDRSIIQVFTNSLADQLEILDDEFFWFPCFSLKYMNIKSTTFEKQMSLSPIYRLLSNHNLHLRTDEEDFEKAILDAEKTTNLTTHPEIRTEICWLHYSVKNLNSLIAPLREEMEKKKNEIQQHRIRSNKLNKFARTLESMINALPSSNPKMALGFALSSLFDNIKQRDFIESGIQQIQDYCGVSFQTVGKYIVEAIILKYSPNVKTKYTPEDKKVIQYSEGDSGVLQRLTRPPLITSSLIPQALRLAQDCITIMKYASDARIGNSIATCFKEPFDPNPKITAQIIDNCLSYFPESMLEYVFTKEEHAALISFYAVFK